MNRTTNQAQLDALFLALGHKKRRDIIHALALGPATVKQLADKHDLSLPAMHKHMRSLEEAQLVLRKKVGRTNVVALSRSGLGRIQDWAKQYHTEWGNDQETLGNYIAGMKQ